MLLKRFEDEMAASGRLYMLNRQYNDKENCDLL